MIFVCYHLVTIQMINSFGLVMSYGNGLDPCLLLVGQSMIIGLMSNHEVVMVRWVLHTAHSHICHP